MHDEWTRPLMPTAHMLELHFGGRWSVLHQGKRLALAAHQPVPWTMALVSDYGMLRMELRLSEGGLFLAAITYEDFTEPLVVSAESPVLAILRLCSHAGRECEEELGSYSSAWLPSVPEPPHPPPLATRQPPVNAHLPKILPKLFRRWAMSSLPSLVLPRLLNHSVTVGHCVAIRLRLFLSRMPRAHGLRRRWRLKGTGKVVAGHGQTLTRTARVRTCGAARVQQA
jgi:hypothetical protein